MIGGEKEEKVHGCLRKRSWAYIDAVEADGEASNSKGTTLYHKRQ